MLNVSSAMGGLVPGHSDSATVAPLRLQLYVRQAFVPQLTLDPFPSLRSSPQQPRGGQTEHSARVKQVHVAMSARGASVVGELVAAAQALRQRHCGTLGRCAVGRSADDFGVNTKVGDSSSSAYVQV